MNTQVQDYQCELEEAQKILEKAEVWSPIVDAYALLKFALSQKQERDEVIATFEKLVDKRASRVPLAYLTESATLAGISFWVGEGVFIPRRQSEPFLQCALQIIEHISNPIVIDLCSGTGALALALVHFRPDANVSAIEVSVDAMTYAQENAKRRKVAGDKPIQLVHGDIADSSLLSHKVGRTDLIMANPPYVKDSQPLLPEWETFHPKEAIYGGPDGFYVVRSTINAAKRFLRTGGTLIIEHDDGQGAYTQHLLEESLLFAKIQLHKDQDGKPRWTTAQRQ